MTTIAWDGRYLAADRLLVFNDNDKCPLLVRKLDVAYQHGNALPGGAVASTGLITERWRAALTEWWLSGHPVHHMPPAGCQSDAGTFIAISPGCLAEVFTYVNPYGTPVGAPDAWGSGCDFAIGAMLMGASAMQAVDAACQRCPRSGGGVDFIDLQDLTAGVQTWQPPATLLDPPLMMALADTRESLDPIAGKPVIETIREALYGALDRADDRAAREWRTVRKPRKDAEGWRTPECTGRLALGTGCGHCLRCNREWFVLLKATHRAVGWDDRGICDIEIPVVQFDTSEMTAKAVLVEPTHVGREPTTPLTPREQLEAMVTMYNDAARRHDRTATQNIERTFREFHFPPGVEMVTDQDDNGIFIRRLIWADDGGAVA